MNLSIKVGLKKHADGSAFRYAYAGNPLLMYVDYIGNNSFRRDFYSSMSKFSLECSFSYVDKIFNKLCRNELILKIFQQLPPKSFSLWRDYRAENPEKLC